MPSSHDIAANYRVVPQTYIQLPSDRMHAFMMLVYQTSLGLWVLILIGLFNIGMANASVRVDSGTHGLQSLAHGCASISFDGPMWIVSDLIFTSSIIYSTPAHQIDWGKVIFNLTNTAIGPDIRLSCEGQNEQPEQFFYGNIWYHCSLINSSLAAEITTEMHGTRARFCYNRPTGQLILNQEWTCWDLDSKHPYVCLILLLTLSEEQRCRNTRESKCWRQRADPVSGH